MRKLGPRQAVDSPVPFHLCFAKRALDEDLSVRVLVSVSRGSRAHASCYAVPLSKGLRSELKWLDGQKSISTWITSVASNMIDYRAGLIRAKEGNLIFLFFHTSFPIMKMALGFESFPMKRFSMLLSL